MTITTATGVAIGARFLAPHAGRVAGKLASRALYRRRVVRRMRARTSFKVPKAPLRSWLKTVTATDLETPFDVSGADLAARLDSHLARYEAGWASNPGHLSRALDLTEAAFLAILAIEDQARYRELAELWARARTGQVLDRLAELGGGYAAGMTPGDRALWLMRRSDGRRRDRLAPFMLEPELIADALATIESRVPASVPGKVQVLTAGFGAGKSETAEQWHRRGIEAYRADPQAALPIWLHARQVAPQGLEAAIRAEAGSNAVTTAVHLVVDGLDEIEGVDAEGVLRDMRVLIGANPASAMLVTTRPDVVPTSNDEIHLAPLTDEEAGQLVDAVSGRRHTAWDWSTELRESIRSPFFALAAGTQFSDAQTIKTQPELIVGLVERALRQGRAQGTTQRQEVFDLLVRCAVDLIDSGGQRDGLSFAERERLRFTRLVAVRESDEVRFALPIFEQWFAAQALLDGSRDMESVLTGPTGFGRWRWSIAIALLSADRDLIDDIVGSIVSFNPGAGAWILARNTRTRWNTTDDEPISQEEAEERLLRAFGTWADAIGEVGAHLLPLTLPDDHSARGRIALGVRVGPPRRLAVGRRLTPAFEGDSCELLPADVHPLFPREDPADGWWPISTGLAPAGSAWPWTYVQQHMARSTLKLLDGHALIGPPGGVWDTERIWRAARIVSRTHDVLHRPLDAAAVRADLAVVLNAMRDDDYEIGEADQFYFDGRTCVGRDLAQLERVLNDSPREKLERPVPYADQPNNRTGMIHGFYSRARMIEFCAETMGLASQAYDEAAATIFGAFRWTLGRGAAGPFGILGAFRQPSMEARTTLGNAPTMDYVSVPMPIFTELVSSVDGATVSRNGRAAFIDGDERGDAWRSIEREATDRLRAWSADGRIESPFWSQTSGGSIIEVGHERPASHRAAGWLFDDLKRLSLGDGIRPQLGEH